MSETKPVATKERQSFARQAIELVVMLAIAFVLASVVRTFLVQPFIIPTGSMIPTIEIGDRVLADKLSYRFKEPEPGDIVVFPDPTGENPTLIKRLIAKEGQVIDIHDGKLFVDDVEQVEPYVHGKVTEVAPGSEGNYPFTVPDGMVWLMGDNRPNSGDSRYFGPQPLSSIYGRGFVTYWPPSHMGALK